MNSDSDHIDSGPHETDADLREVPSEAEHGADEVEAATDRPAKEESEDEIEALRNRLEKLELESKEYRNLLLRAQAEAENTAKRADREIMKARKYALEEFSVSLLEVKDNLERGLASGDTATAAALRQGIDLTLKLLVQVFDRFGIEELNPAGEAFDPKLHQAMTVEENGDYPSDTVVKVMQKGYQLRDRLLRPALVIVSSKPDRAGDASDSA